MVGSGENRGLMRKVTDLNPNGFVNDGGVDHEWTYLVVIQIPDRKGRTVLVVVVVVPVKPRVSQQGCDHDGNRCGVDEGSLGS